MLLCKHLKVKNMKKRLQEKAKRIAQNPATKKALLSLKPQKSVWGFLGVIVFFILPEIIAYFYASEITAYASKALLHANSVEMEYCYKLLVMLFEDGVSWLNLIIGFALLIWLFF